MGARGGRRDEGGRAARGGMIHCVAMMDAEIRWAFTLGEDHPPTISERSDENVAR